MENTDAQSSEANPNTLEAIRQRALDLILQIPFLATAARLAVDIPSRVLQELTHNSALSELATTLTKLKSQFLVVKVDSLEPYAVYLGKQNLVGLCTVYQEEKSNESGIHYVFCIPGRNITMAEAKRTGRTIRYPENCGTIELHLGAEGVEQKPLLPIFFDEGHLSVAIQDRPYKQVAASSEVAS